MTTAFPENLTDPAACVALLVAGLTMTCEAGAWDALPAEARDLFAAALFSVNGPAEAVADLARERDDERALSNTLIAKLGERDATIRALRALVRNLLPLAEQWAEGRSPSHYQAEVVDDARSALRPLAA